MSLQWNTDEIIAGDLALVYTETDELPGWQLLHVEPPIWGRVWQTGDQWPVAGPFRAYSRPDEVMDGYPVHICMVAACLAWGIPVECGWWSPL